jgi:hypothetical protein
VRVLVISESSWPKVDGEVDGEFLMVARPFDALYGHRFDVIVAPSRHFLGTNQKDYDRWWDESVACRLAPNGKVIYT